MHPLQNPVCWSWSHSSPTCNQLHAIRPQNFIRIS